MKMAAKKQTDSEPVKAKTNRTNESDTTSSPEVGALAASPCTPSVNGGGVPEVGQVGLVGRDGPAFAMIPLDEIRESGSNPRKTFGQKSLDELTESVRERGVLEPILVRPADEMAGEGIAVTRYEIVAGTRRFRASKAAGLYEIPSIVHDVDDVTALEMRVTENLHREDVHPLEEAQGYRELLDTGRYGEGRVGVEALAARMNCSVSYVYQRLKLLDLIPAAQEALVAGRIVIGHAILLVRLSELQQASLLSTMEANKHREWSVADAKNFCDREFFCRLKDIPWGFEDATLVEEEPACSKCFKRTGHDAVLFDEAPTDDRCLDKSCFDAKRAAFVKRQLKAAKEFPGGVIQLTGADWARTKTLEYLGDFVEVEKETLGAKAAVLVDHTDLANEGRLTYVVAKQSKEGKAAAKGRELSDQEKHQKEREREERLKQDIARQYRLDVLEAIWSQAKDGLDFEAGDVVRRAVARLFDIARLDVRMIAGKVLGLKPVMVKDWQGKEKPTYEGCLASNPEALEGDGWIRMLLYLAWAEAAKNGYAYESAEACALAFEVDLEQVRAEAALKHEKPAGKRKSDGLGTERNSMAPEPVEGTEVSK
jgi:ParB/RepB/Spo0J family partition protein